MALALRFNKTETRPPEIDIFTELKMKSNDILLSDLANDRHIANVLSVFVTP